MNKTNIASALRGDRARHAGRRSYQIGTVGLIVFGLVLGGCKSDPETAKPASVAKHTHEVVGETCFICDPAKREPGRLWCKEHGRYEDRCWECHPDLRDAKRDFCEEHGLYEDECFLCDPSRASGPASAPHAHNTSEPEIFCNEHNVPEDQCGICQPELAGRLEVGEDLKIRLASPRSAEIAGLEIGHARAATTPVVVNLLGEVRFNGNKHARVTPLAAGVLTTTKVDVGTQVKAGQLLAFVNAPAVAAAKADFLTAQSDLQMRRAASERQLSLSDAKVGRRRDLESASARYRRAQVAVKLAKAQLRNLGFSAAEVAAVRDARSQLPLRAPFAGTVVRRSAVLGEAVDRTRTLFEIADLGDMWVEVSVPEDQVQRLRLGQALELTPKGDAGVRLKGEITWVSPLVDPKTRMVRARGIVPNLNRVLRDGMFVDVQVTTALAPDAVQVPVSAVHRVDNLPFVFVRESQDLFAAKRIELGASTTSGSVVVRQGVGPSDDLVVVGGFAIKSALLAARLGAGCTDD